MSSSGAIAERRIAMLIDASVSRLPPLLTAYAGMNPGFIIAHVTAAALSSENKSLAHPASLDILPMSANQEDHVSMETFAARRLKPMIRNTAHILGIELLAAAQGVESSGRCEVRWLRKHCIRCCASSAQRCRGTGTWRRTSSASPGWSRVGWRPVLCESWRALADFVDAGVPVRSSRAT